MKTLSIRQPWAWLIVNGYKPIENRDWATRYRGPFLVHASKGMTREEYEDARDLAEQQGIAIPAPHELQRGGIVGMATVTGCATESPSPWFFGKFGFELAEARPLPFMPINGRLGFFDVDYLEAAHV